MASLRSRWYINMRPRVLKINLFCSSKGPFGRPLLADNGAAGRRSATRGAPGSREPQALVRAACTACVGIVLTGY